MIRILPLALAAAVLAALAAPALATPLVLPQPALRGALSPIPVQTCEVDCGCEVDCVPEPEPRKDDDNEPA